jgi:hypothetical protein
MISAEEHRRDMQRLEDRIKRRKVRIATSMKRMADLNKDIKENQEGQRGCLRRMRVISDGLTARLSSPTQTGRPGPVPVEQAEPVTRTGIPT